MNRPTEKQLKYWASMFGKPGNKKGKPVSFESRQKISLTLKKKGIIPPSQRGLKNPTVSMANKNRITNAETREKHSRAMVYLWKNGIRKGGYKVKDKTNIINAIARQKKSGTSIEIKLEQRLKENGINYKSQMPLCGITIADFYLPDHKTAIYADGDYWHNRPGVPEKDARINGILQANGYQVLRFWEHEIKTDISACLEKITAIL